MAKRCLDVGVRSSRTSPTVITCTLQCVCKLMELARPLTLLLVGFRHASAPPVSLYLPAAVNPAVTPGLCERGAGASHPLSIPAARTRDTAIFNPK